MFLPPIFSKTLKQVNPNGEESPKVIANGLMIANTCKDIPASVAHYKLRLTTHLEAYPNDISYIGCDSKWRYKDTPLYADPVDLQTLGVESNRSEGLTDKEWEKVLLLYPCVREYLTSPKK